MSNNAEPLERLIEQFSKFPGVGRKGATRMAYQVLSMQPEQAMELSKAIQDAHTRLHRCRVCMNYTEQDVCKICSSPKRDHSMICVVESPRDIVSFERTREYNGLYHAARPYLPHGRCNGRSALCEGAFGPFDRRHRKRGHHGHQPHRGR